LHEKCQYLSGAYSTPRVSLLNPEHELLLVILRTWDIGHNISVCVAQFANGFLPMCERSPTGPSRPLARSLSAPSVASEEHMNQEHKHDGNTEHWHWFIQTRRLLYSSPIATTGSSKVPCAKSGILTPMTTVSLPDPSQEPSQPQMAPIANDSTRRRKNIPTIARKLRRLCFTTVTIRHRTPNTVLHALMS
jgi:hypothetical protein